MMLTHELRLGPGRPVGTGRHTSEWAEMAGLKPNTLGITKRSASLTLCVTSLSAVGALWRGPAVMGGGCSGVSSP